MSKSHDNLTIGHFTVLGAIKEVSSENLRLYAGWMSWLRPIFFKVTTRKMAMALLIIAVYLHVIPQSNANK